MTIQEQVLQLPKNEKIIMMEALWTDLSCQPFDPPAWHMDVLKDTEKAIAEGKEQFIDWDEAKKLLREI